MIGQKVVFITGVSSGFGKATALYLSEKGYTVYGTVRKNIAEDLPYKTILMDVTSSESVRAGIIEVLQAEGRIDVLINNAGIAVAGSIEDTSTDEFQRQLDTNLYGAHRLCREVLPSMRHRRSGLIINIGSLADQIGLPYQGAYSAAKCALSSLTESMRLELIPFGIHTVLIEPGDFKTALTNNRIFTIQSNRDSVYYSSMERALAIMEKEERRGPDPIKLARLIEKILKMKNPRFRYMTGPAFEILAIRLKRLLPVEFFHRLIRLYYKIGMNDLS